MVMRALKHLFTPHWLALRPFPPATLTKIEQAVKSSERAHRGELRFALEGPLHLGHLRTPARERARQVFGQLGVWDTAENSGVLIYVQLVDHRIEIVADRGIAAKVEQREWEAVCRAMERAFKAGNYEAGALEAIQSVTAILARHFPAGAVNPNELSDKPAVL
jgi:uncharacterized membrane protein